MLIIATLNILGYIIGALFFLFTTFFLLALFCKFRYDIEVGKASLDAPWVYSARASWFFGLLKLLAKDGEEPKLKIAGMTLNLGASDERDDDEESEKSETIQTFEELNGRFEKARKRTTAKRRRVKLKARIDNIKNALKFLKEIELKAVLAAILELLKQIFKRIRPKKLRIRGKIGLKEPDRTGMVMAAVSVVQTLGFDIAIQGDFELENPENMTLELDISANGGFRLWSLGQIALKTWRKPEIRRLIRLVTNKNINKRKDDTHGN